MSGLEPLVPLIYHEKQQPGSMLCAQHALNSLLQGPYFTPTDLSEIALKLDVLEEQYNTEAEHGVSKNMDDTGFFSVQVMEEALKVWGLNLLRWRNSAMQSHQDHPETQLAFILNLEQHWFSLRRFGPISGNVNRDASLSHWFNLNSSLPAPEWVSKVYLGMVLQQAEAEGYSVFVITQSDPSNMQTLARGEADDIAATLPEPQTATRFTSSRTTTHDAESSTSVHQDFHIPASTSQAQPALDHDDVDGIDDEDYELQAVLQASLASQEGYTSPLHSLDVSEPSISSPPPLTAATTSTRANRRSLRGSSETDHVDLDPVATSMERNRKLLQQMREEQEYAQKELWSSNNLTTEERAALEARQLKQREREEEEEEEFRKALAESVAMAQKRDGQQEHRNSTDPPNSQEHIMPSTSSGHFGQDFRNYDDEDAEFQAALKASLENVPLGGQHSVVFPSAPRPPETRAAPHASVNSGRQVEGRKTEDPHNDMNVDGDGDVWMSESEVSADDDNTSKKKIKPALEEHNAPPSLDEIRKARLARFGS
ncbi:hypothetical protein AGABI1DRAFT_119519 [Agaricus bisporus var. burnettii JB137-S8]|uniref:ubiquitinyl hydrolase 1 n=2 Tax=Agaricus bisporus var. burnettii TaxID=192524 RepID=K5WZL7_AGABU|nr:uncharacterized protein AGABI1DRAFT_119519 [Agaricus bisporus var. burnettii JB137-S8]EKM80981.1 hypothetical protein AGABI1DRAFT_119519 [Agaricus bisporus var. burnettii JB137-S8]KAF7782573.1 hypothetical protein Agabi119p4_1949 [Agaricus bisporus var. burnettii]